MVFGLSLLIAYSIVVRYVINKAGFCLLQDVGNDDTWFIKLLTAWSSLSIVMQVSLLGFFVYPLLKQASWNKNQHATQNHRMLQVVKKSVIPALFPAYLHLAISKGSNNQEANVVYSGNLVVNHLATIACLGYWRKLLWPWSLKCQINNPLTAVNKTAAST